MRARGEPIVRREVWRGIPKVGWGGIVVEDTLDLLALFMPEGSPFGFADDFFGAPHPWSHHDRWEGHGVLQLQRPGEMHAVWVFWHGPDREFRGWYVNLQEPFRHTPLGFDTQDRELDLVVAPDGSWRYKDEEELAGWMERGRWTVSRLRPSSAKGRESLLSLKGAAAGGATTGPSGDRMPPGERQPCRRAGPAPRRWPPRPSRCRSARREWRARP
jgi:hypothetical protein